MIRVTVANDDWPGAQGGGYAIALATATCTRSLGSMSWPIGSIKHIVVPAGDVVARVVLRVRPRAQQVRVVLAADELRRHLIIEE